ncbi:MAG: GFA family protein, partial [Proteobacteria bacterium]
LEKGGGKCNCSMCQKTRNWSTTVKPEAFQLLTSKEALSDYKFNTESVHNYFCKNCGVRSFTEGFVKEIGGAFVSVQLACLDLSDEEFAVLGKAPVRISNGRDDDWMHEPKQKSHL